MPEWPVSTVRTGLRRSVSRSLRRAIGRCIESQCSQLIVHHCGCVMRPSVCVHARGSMCAFCVRACYAWLECVCAFAGVRVSVLLRGGGAYVDVTLCILWVIYISTTGTHDTAYCELAPPEGYSTRIHVGLCVVWSIAARASAQGRPCRRSRLRPRRRPRPPPPCRPLRRRVRASLRTPERPL